MKPRRYNSPLHVMPYDDLSITLDPTGLASIITLDDGEHIKVWGKRVLTTESRRSIRSLLREAIVRFIGRDW